MDSDEILRIPPLAEETGLHVLHMKGGTSHMIVRYKDKETSFPMHGSKEIGTGLVQAIKKQLGLK